MSVAPCTNWVNSGGAKKFADMDDSHLINSIEYVKKKYGSEGWKKKPELFYMMAEAFRRDLKPKNFDYRDWKEWALA